MKQEELLRQITAIAGGEGNISRTMQSEEVLYLTVKDMGVVDLSSLERLEGVASVSLVSGRLKIVLTDRKKESKIMAKQNQDYTELARQIVANIGGKENVERLRHCVTRCRFTLKDESKADTETIKNLDGVVTVVKAGGEYMVVIGEHVALVYDAVCRQLGLPEEGAAAPAASEDKSTKMSKGKIVSTMINTIMGCLAPALNIICAAGILKGLLTILSILGVVSEGQGFYMLLNAMGDAVYYFLPLLLGFNLAKNLNMDPVLGFAIGATLCYPTIQGVDISIFGMTVNATYTSSFLPVIFAVLLALPITKFFGKVIPKVVANFLVPVCTLLIVIPLGFSIIGPAANTLGDWINSGTQALLSFSPVLAGLLVGGIYQVLVLFGLHGMLVTFAFVNVLSGNPDQLLALSLIPCFAQTGVTLAMYLRTKDQKLKGVALPAFVSGVFGVTEPIIYGVTLPHIKMFVLGCIGAALGGAATMLAGIYQYAYTGIGVFALLGMMNPENPSPVAPAIVMLFTFVVSFVMAFILYKDEPAKA